MTGTPSLRTTMTASRETSRTSVTPMPPSLS
jgi:hypothetical protein